MDDSPLESSAPSPPAQGVRLDWHDIPATVRAAVEGWLGSAVVTAISQPSGFSPGVAARLRTSDGRRVFLKAVGPLPNPDSPKFHRREAQVTALMPPDAPVPRLLWWHDDAETGWVVLVFEEIDGKHPAQPWRTDELDRVVDAMAVLADALTPSPLSTDIIGTASEEIENQICGWQLKGEDAVLVSRLDAWSARHLDTLAQIEAGAGAAAAGNTMLNFDIRADNILLTPDRVWFLDWPWARVGAAWIDVVFFAPSVTMQGGPPPEQVCARHPAYRAADPEAITAVVASIAGYFTVHALRPPPPGLPTVRAFQAAQGVVAREWLSERTGLS